MLINEKHISKKEKRIKKNRQESQNLKIFEEQLEVLKLENRKLVEQVQTLTKDQNTMAKTNDVMVKQIVKHGIMVANFKKKTETLQRLRQDEFQEIASLSSQLEEGRRMNYFNGCVYFQ